MIKREKTQVNLLTSKGNARRSVVKVLDQTGKTKSIPRDKGRLARLPGKRISKTGKIYWETRRNRSDRAGTRL